MISGQVADYKVAYIKDNSSVMYAKMFDKIEPALDFAHKLPGRWLLMKRVGQDGADYAWKILPYGASSSYRTCIKLDAARYLIFGIAIIAIIYFAAKLFSKKSAGSMSMSAPSLAPASPAPM